MSRIADIPIYAQREDQVSAKLYNLWRRAKLHFGYPIRIPLTKPSGTVMVLEKHEWVCCDQRQNELPLLAWVEFEDKGRDALHLPVKCKLNYYHFAASKLRALALAEMEEKLGNQLHEDSQT